MAADGTKQRRITAFPLPRTLEIRKFANSRASELESLHSIVSSRLNGDFRSQRNKRRRTTGFNNKAANNRNRKRSRVGESSKEKDGGLGSAEEGKEKKLPRRIRRRIELKKNPEIGFVASGDGTRRLRTHLWHAKRFSMTKLWGFYLPLGLQGKGKGSRAFLKWYKQGSVVHDASYYSAVQLEGPEDTVLSVLRMVLDLSPMTHSVDCSTSEHSRCILCGDVYGSSILHQVGSHPFEAICPVTYMWRPQGPRVDEEVCNTDEGHKTHSTSSRQLWIWMHTSALSEGYDALRTVCQKKDWGNANWGPHTGWEHQAQSNGEDWGAKARAWAAAKNTTENQHPSLQSHYPSQYMPASDSHYHENEQINVHSSSYQNYPGPAAQVDKQHVAHQPDPAAASAVNPYYAPDGNFSYARKDGNFPDMGTTYPPQDAFMSPSVHKQEVPSSYSSIPGGQFSTEQQPKGSGNRDSMLDQSQFSYGNQSISTNTDPCDLPLQFTPKYNHDNNPMMVAGYLEPIDHAKVMDSGTAVPTLQPWTSPAPSISFPSVSPTFPSAAQLDPTINMPPLAGQPPPMLGRAPVPNFHSAVPSLSSPIGLGTGTSFHPAMAYHGDVYGTPMSSERPKKALPNWLRDEVIKTKDTIVSSGTGHHKEESDSIDDEFVDKSVSKSDQADSKSIDSSRSNEEEEEEDYEEAARTAAINQEIKRVLTEVLLKVTSDLFDEIATKVLSEDDNPIDVKNENNAQNQKLSPPPPAPASKVSEKVLIPVKTKEPKSEDVSDESTSSGAAGNVLGLVNYASDDDDEIGSSVAPKSDKSSKIMLSSNKEHVESMNDTVETCHSLPDSESLNKNLVNAGSNHKHASQFDDLADRRGDRKMNNNGAGPLQLTNPVERKVDSITDHGRVMDSFDDSRTHNFSSTTELEAPSELIKKASKHDFHEKDTRRRDRQENRSSSARDSAKEAEKIEVRENNKGDKVHGRHDERHQRKKSEDRSGSKDRSKEQGVKYEEKTKELDSKRRSPHRHAKKASEKDDVHRKSERSKDDRSKHKHASDRGRHKRRRSSSVDSRGRNSKDTSVASYSDNSTDEASEKSRRKTHSKRRDLSPSPVRSRRRQVSQSPPSSKASQRRHSPYSSLEASRGRRSRSRSPTHRRR